MTDDGPRMTYLGRGPDASRGEPPPPAARHQPPACLITWATHDRLRHQPPACLATWATHDRLRHQPPGCLTTQATHDPLGHQPRGCLTKRAAQPRGCRTAWVIARSVSRAPDQWHSQPGDGGSPREASGPPGRRCPLRRLRNPTRATPLYPSQASGSRSPTRQRASCRATRRCSSGPGSGPEALTSRHTAWPDARPSYSATHSSYRP
jgi:hypothetical protein